LIIKTKCKKLLKIGCKLKKELKVDCKKGMKGIKATWLVIVPVIYFGK
jgi:hypothetical protein